jgi:hypothetical protein
MCEALCYKPEGRGFDSRILSKTVVLNLGYANTFYINQKETQEPLEPLTSSEPHTHEDSSPN